eukprot:CAMPEP_0203678362 /NCGR_PEP_ID=MMETSP0090-20130426/31664_1 /ASSEMBLY_ACC=CAM_ASM_001088 /TAXON_ID=426623 /ORGANISM="Chaetoceros affinis, Strain CCMP159" /LENGTH=239 /DNA_ID=CAMNT_0050545569 /DNA_START=26 /DNA_END=745 /DNA_ORIENTATION=-
MKIQIPFILLVSLMPSSMVQAFSVNSNSNNNISNEVNTGSDNRRSFLQKSITTAVSTAAVLTGGVVNNPMPALASEDTSGITIGGKLRMGDESIMAPKNHGTSEVPVQESLRYGVSNKLADKISNYNRRFAEFGGYFAGTTFEDEVRSANGPITFYDSNSGKPLFVAPINRSVDEFIEESKYHGWPSFRDQEVVWDNVRVLRNSGETVSVDGTHLGHNIPDKRGNRYCINLVSVAGNPI